MQFTPVVERITHSRSDGLNLASPENTTDVRVSDWSVSPEKFGQFYISIFDEWVRHDVGEYYVTQFDATLAKMPGNPSGTCIFSDTCGHAGVMEFNGDVYSCDHFVFPEYKLGNIMTDSIRDMMFSDQQIKFGKAKHDELPSEALSRSQAPMPVHPVHRLSGSTVNTHGVRLLGICVFLLRLPYIAGHGSCFVMYWDNYLHAKVSKHISVSIIVEGYIKSVAYSAAA